LTLGLRGSYNRAVPTDLAALLAEEGAVSPEALERALERQREVGGALDTALLEARALPEERLVACLARAAELSPAPPEAWSAADARARRVFPSRVAERHGLAPFALDGRELALVATYPVDLALLDEISFMLSLNLTAHVAPEWRVRALIHRLYGSALSPRLAVLAAEDGTSLEALPGPPPAPEDAGEAPDPRSAPPSGFARDEAEPLEPLAAALQQALEADGGALLEELVSDVAGRRDEPRGGDGGPRADGGAEPQEDEPAEQDVEPERPPADRSAPPGWTLEDARGALAAARDRDEVVLVALRHARDYFAYAAVFAVTRDALAGHDALGVEDERERARSVAIWASDPGMLRTVLETRSPYLGRVDREAAGTEAIVSGLGREAARTVLLFPVLLRDRPVCLLYADNGEAPISVRGLGDLLLFLAGVGPALERIILARKKGRTPGSRPEVPVRQFAPAAEPAVERPPERGAGRDEPRRSPAEPDLSPAPDGAAPAEPPARVAEAALAALEVDVDLDGLAPEPAAAREAPGPAEPEPPSLSALAERALEADEAVAREACDALARRRRDDGMRPAHEKLRRALLSGISLRSRRAARALGAVRDAEAIPLLIQVLETSEPETAAAAADALAAVTLHRLGADARRWLAWWKENRGRGRAEWLFSGLTSPERETRIAASLELSMAAPPPVAYSADFPPAEREQAARAWAVWWARSGLVA
jgi:hypothetical protein